jgi:Ca-activated chloride channel homolog
MPVFESPLALFMLAAVPLYIGLRRRFGAMRGLDFPFSSGRERIFETSGNSFALPKPRTSRLRVFIHRLGRALFWAGFVVLCLACARPALSHRETYYLDRGREVVFVLDASPSMAAQEDGTSRFSSCVSIMEDFSRVESNAVLGLVAFGSEAALVVPPTGDRQYFRQRLESLKPGDYGEGTAIGMGIVTALYHVRASKAVAPLVIVFTDGENNAGATEPARAAELCQSFGVKLYLVGIGSEGALPMSWTDPKTGRVFSGEYESHFDPATLRDIAAKTSGRYISARDVAGLAAARKDILGESFSVGRVRHETRNDSLVKLFCQAALICFALSFFCSSVLLESSECL